MTDKTRPWILGIGSSYHNGAACLLHGTEVVVAIQEERLLRMKRARHPAGRASLAVRYCLDTAGIEPKDLTGIAVSRLSDSPDDDVRLSPQLRPAEHGICVINVTHHVAHAAAAFASSGFPSAAVLVVDGRGSPLRELSPAEFDSVAMRHRFTHDDPAVCETISIYGASGNELRSVEKHVAQATGHQPGKMRRFFSLGSLFLNVGEHVFGEGLDGSGKVMGLAPYGCPTIAASEFFELIDGEFVFSDTVPRRFDDMPPWPSHQQEYADLAASTQSALEVALLSLSRRCVATGMRRLCYAGGVALNSVANEKMIRNSSFDDVFIMPAAEDSGVALGAAYCALWQMTSETRRPRQTRDSVGRHYSSNDIGQAIARQELVTSTRSRAGFTRAAAGMLASGKIIGWFQDGSELGPRALGQRSILADPRRPDIKDLLNAKVKFREAFRPFAPSVLESAASEWFDMPAGLANSPFMLRVMDVLEERRHLVPGVVHIDGTARVQTVARQCNDVFHALLSAFHEKTGVPILINTSFNTAGEPIVETPEDALWCMIFSDIDACILGDYIVTRRPGFRSPLEAYPKIVRHVVIERQVDGAGDVTHRSAFLHSCCEAGISPQELALLARRAGGDYVRIKVDSRWGCVVHIFGGELRSLFTLMDGTRNAQEILDQWNLRDNVITPLGFRRLLHRLAGTGIITLSLAPRAPHQVP